MTSVLVMMTIAAVGMIGLQLYCEYKQSFEEPEDHPKPAKKTAKKVTKKKVVKVSIKKRK